MSVNWFDVETVGFECGIEFEVLISIENLNKIHRMSSCSVMGKWI